jgi:exopolysaccharide biosynthesis protein
MKPKFSKRTKDVFVPNPIWRYVGIFGFSFAITAIAYAAIGYSFNESEISRDRPSCQVTDLNACVESDRPTALAPSPSLPKPQVKLVQSTSTVEQQAALAALAAKKLTQSQKTQALPKTAIAQTTASTQQGQEISLNGRKFSVAWTQWNQGNSARTGISDTGAMQTLGIELLNTNRSDVQPVLWFPANLDRPISLSAKAIGAYRYLDVTDLMAQAGANLRISGKTLYIDLPQAQILNIRQGNQTWGKRLVIDLDRPAFWQVSQTPTQGAVIIEGNATPQLLAQFKPPSETASTRQVSDEDDMGSGSTAPKKSGAPLFSLKNENATTKIVLDLPTAHGVQVFSLTNPNRLVVDIRPDALKTREIAWAPGIVWRQQYINLKGDYFPVSWLEIDPRSPQIAIKPITSNPNTLEGTSPILTTARTQQAIAAINGGFFNRNTKQPLGAIRQNNRWLSSPILNRGAIAWNEEGQIKIGRLTLQEVLTTSSGNRLPVLFLNSGYVQAGLARYTSEWGTRYKTLSDKETIVVVENNRVTQQVQAGTAGKDSFTIPANGYLLTIRKNGAPVSALAIGTQVDLQNATIPADFANYPHVVGAGPLLIQNGNIVLNAASEQFSKGFQKQMASRSAIATSSRGTIILAAIHNRVGGRGATLNELAQIMQAMGAVDALNLDGGSSTSLSLGGQLIDRSPVTAARVHNGIGVFLSP